VHNNGEVSAAAGRGVDAAGKVESRGIDHIPAVERHGGPIDFAWAFGPSQLGFVIAVFGSFPIAFGLSLWSTLSAILVGTAIGSLLISFQALSGPKTGTTQSVTSVAFFGVHGRLIGAVLALVTNIGFGAIIAWTTGQAFVWGLHRLIGTPTGDGVLAIGMALVIVGMIVLGFYGHATLIASYKVIAVVNTVLQLAILAVFAHDFSAVHGGSYLLGSAGATWALSVALIASVPISYATWPNDYGRYMPEDTAPAKIVAWAFGGMFVGCTFAFVLGALVATTFVDPAGQFVPGVMQGAPVAFIPLLLVYALTGNVINGAPGVYNAALDLHALLFFLKRTVVVLIVGAAMLVASFLAVIVLDAVDTVTAFVTINAVLLSAWMGVTLVGLFTRGNRYHTADLHAFATPGHRGRYWFTGGFNLRAVGAMAVGSGVGLLFSQTTLFTGPLAAQVNGIDLSFGSSFVVTAALYALLVALVPEPGVSPAHEDQLPAPSGRPTPALGGDPVG
jgi:purine-cytosine permease-like protein